MGRWSPTRDVHALAGSSCASWDLFLFDPNGGSGKTPGTLTNLTANDERNYRDWDLAGFVWAPDGVRIAARARHSLVLIDTKTGSITDLAEASGFSELRPLAWNPAGTHLLFQMDPPAQIDCANPGEETYLDSVPDLGGP